MERNIGQRIPLAAIARAVFGQKRPSVMAVFIAYFDASGRRNEPSGKALTVAGYASSESRWAKFEAEWLAALQAEDVAMLHMKDFAHFKGAFKAWRNDEAKRQRFLQSLIRIIKRRTLRGISATLLLEDYERINTLFPVRERVGSPYTIACMLAMAQTDRWMQRNHNKANDGLLFVFESGGGDQHDFRRFLSELPKDTYAVEPVFVRKSATAGVPLQAADYLAYEVNKAFRNRFKGTVRARKSGAPLFPNNKDRGYKFHGVDDLIDLCQALRLPRRKS